MLFSTPLKRVVDLQNMLPITFYAQGNLLITFAISSDLCLQPWHFVFAYRASILLHAFVAVFQIPVLGGRVQSSCSTRSEALERLFFLIGNPFNIPIIHDFVV